MIPYDYVILAIPPSVWADVPIIGRWQERRIPTDEIGKMGMAPAVKFFSDVKERFWIKKKAAPYGGSLTLGQVWEGTDNQTRVEPAKSGSRASCSASLPAQSIPAATRAHAKRSSRTS